MSKDPKYLSDCHNADVYVVSTNEGTNSYACSTCDKLCGFYPAPQELERQIDEILIQHYGDDTLAGPNSNNLKARTKALSLFKAYGAEVAREAKYQLLQDLIEWHDQWKHVRPEELFNFYGAIKAMQVMQNPQKPFNILEAKDLSAPSGEGKE